MLIEERDLAFGQCRSTRAIFRSTFPHGAAVTVENAKRAARAGLSLKAAAEQLLPPKALEQFQWRADQLLATYLWQTEDTRERLKALLMSSAYRTELAEADAAHRENMQRCWMIYLDALAEVFVEEATQFPPI